MRRLSTQNPSSKSLALSGGPTTSHLRESPLPHHDRIQLSRQQPALPKPNDPMTHAMLVPGCRLLLMVKVCWRSCAERTALSGL